MYNWPAKYIEESSGAAANALRLWRSCASQQQEWFLACAKKTPEDRERARLLKSFAAHWLRLQRACTLALPYFGALDRNQKAVDPRLWPLDLRAELDEVAGRLLLIDTGISVSSWSLN